MNKVLHRIINLTEKGYKIAFERHSLKVLENTSLPPRYNPLRIEIRKDDYYATDLVDLNVMRSQDETIEDMICMALNKMEYYFNAKGEADGIVENRGGNE